MCALLVLGAVSGAEPAGRLETVTKISLAVGVQDSITLQGREGIVKSWLSFPWAHDLLVPDSGFAGISFPVWHMGGRSRLVEFGPLDFSGTGFFLDTPFAETSSVHALGNKPFSLASPDDSSFRGCVLGNVRGFFIVDEESKDLVFGVWEAQGLLGTGFIAAVQKKTPAPLTEWFEAPDIDGLAAWTLLHVRRAGDYSKFFLVGGQYAEFPGRTGFFVRTDIKLMYGFFYFSGKYCLGDGAFRAVGGSTIPLYDMSAALGFSGTHDSGMELKLKETASMADTPAKKKISLAAVADFKYFVLNLDSAIDFGSAGPITMFSVGSSMSSDLVKGLVLGTYWESSDGISRRFDVSLAAGVKAKISADTAVVVRFLETSRSLKISCSLGTQLGGFSVKLRSSMIEPWIFFPEIALPEIDISLVLSTDDDF